MKSLTAIEHKIKTLANKSTSFKIGKTSQPVEYRLRQHKKYDDVEVIVKSKYKKEIDRYEEAMLNRFIDHPKCDNKNVGSAARMANKPLYVLYGVYNKKRR